MNNDPCSKAVRTYYPDFLSQNKDGSYTIILENLDEDSENQFKVIGEFVKIL